MLSITACSPRPRLGTLLSPGPCYHSELGKTSVPLVMSSPSWSCLSPPCARYPAGASLELRIRHILPFLLHSVGVIVRNVIRTSLVRLVFVDDDAFPDGRGELWVTSLAILAYCRSTPAATAALNSWNSVSCLKISQFSSIILAFSVWSVLV